MEKPLPIELSPPLAKDFIGYPRTVLHVGEYDMFMDEGKDFIEKLAQNQIEARVVTYPGMVHNFIQYYPHIPELKDSIDIQMREIADFYHTNIKSQALVGFPQS